MDLSLSSKNRNIRLKVIYDGFSFYGWESTRFGPSIEETLKTVLQRILQENILLTAASRTDRGVHAACQTVNFFTRSALCLDKLQKSLNALLPSTIKIKSIDEMELSFHATLDALSKMYRYEIDLGPFQSPFRSHLAWHVPYQLDLPSIEKALSLFIGRKNYSAFANAREGKKGPPENPQCEIFSFTYEPNSPHHLILKIHGNRFLYKMVRNIVGTVVAVGRSKMTVDSVRELFNTTDRELAGMTAPAHGLYLERVFYGEKCL